MIRTLTNVVEIEDRAKLEKCAIEIRSIKSSLGNKGERKTGI